MLEYRFQLNSTIKMAVMIKSRQIMDVIGLGNAFVVFRGQFISVNRLTQILCLVITIGIVIPSTYYCFLHRNHFNDISETTCMLLVAIYITLIYIDLLRNKTSIHWTIDLLERIILKCLSRSM